MGALAGAVRMKCHRDGCSASAEFHVGLEIACFTTDILHGFRQMLQSPTTIKVCGKHAKQKLLLDYLLSDQNKAAIVAGLSANYVPMPDFSTAEVVFFPINAPA